LSDIWLAGNAGEAGTHIRIRADVLAETTPGQIEVSDSYGLAYDAAGRATARYSRTTVDGTVRDEVEFTQYTQRGQRRYEFYAQAVGGESSGIARTHTYDAAGHLLETRRYFELGTTKEVWVAPIPMACG
jgi:hypothetical protein